MDFAPELRWTAAALPGTDLTLVAVYSPDDDVVRASGVAVPEEGEPHAAAIGRLLLTLIDRLAVVDPPTADREMRPLPVEPRDGVEQPVADALAAYARGEIAAIDSLAAVQPGSAFRQAAWEALRGITPGSPVTYTGLAERAGSPRAVRAAGGACAANLVAVVVPCHRVVRTGGKPGQYLYGTAAKTALLEHEARHAG